MAMQKDESRERIGRRFEVIERVHLYGPMERLPEITEKLIDKRYIITQSGPKIDKETIKIRHKDRFHVIAERTVEPGTTIWGNKNENII